MSLNDWLKRLAFLLPLSLAAASVSVASAADGACAGGSCSTVPTCDGHCGWPFHCPGPYVHCTPKVPCLKYKCSCGKPLCDICDMPGYGYYPTCWRTWDQPVNYFCPVPTPTQLVHPPVDVLLVPGGEHPPMPRRNGDGVERR
jgi:hypothetical protein